MTKSFRIVLAVVLITIALVGVATFARAQQPQTNLEQFPVYETARTEN
jgi:CHASE1-domain containing sensor protein